MGDHWASITTWLKADPEIATWIDTEIAHVKVAEQILQGWLELARYQGLDIKHLLKKIKSKHDNYVPRNMVSSLDYTQGAVLKNVTFTDSEKLFKDIAMMIFIFATRGTSWEKMKKKSRPEFVMVMDMLQDKYDLNVAIRAPGSVLGPDEITVARVAACFLTVVADYYHGGLGKPLTSLAALGLPAGLDEASKGLYIICFLAAVLNDNVIHRKDKKKTDLTDIMTYFRTAVESPGVPQAARMIWMKSRGIITANGKLAPSILAAVGGAEDKLFSARPGDTGHDAIIAELQTFP